MTRRRALSVCATLGLTASSLSAQNGSIDSIASLGVNYSSEHAGRLSRVSCSKPKDVFIFREVGATQEHGAAYVCLGMRHGANGFYFPFNSKHNSEIKESTAATVAPASKLPVCKRSGNDSTQYTITDSAGMYRGRALVCTHGTEFQGEGLLNNFLGANALISVRGSSSENGITNYEFRAKLNKKLLFWLKFDYKCSTDKVYKIRCQ